MRAPGKELWCTVPAVDEGPPIAYQVLSSGVPVLGSDGLHVGTVEGVLSAQDKDIFHGLLISTPKHGVRFLEAAAIASLHEHAVDLRIDSAAVQSLPPPEHAAPMYDEDPTRQQEWRHWARWITGRNDWNREP